MLDAGKSTSDVGGGPIVPLLQSLVMAWRAEAKALRHRYGMEQLASLCAAHAEELAHALSVPADEILTQDVAVSVSGYSSSYLRSLLATGALTNVGRRGAPRYLRRELPRKASRSTREAPINGAFDAEAAAQHALKVLNQGSTGPRP